MTTKQYRIEIRTAMILFLAVGSMNCLLRRDQNIMPDTIQLMEEEHSYQDLESLKMSITNRLEKDGLIKKQYSKEEAERAVDTVVNTLLIVCLLKKQNYTTLDTAFIINDLIKKHGLPFKHTFLSHQEIGLMVHTIDFGIQYLKYRDHSSRLATAYGKEDIQKKCHTDPSMVDKLYLVPVDEKQLLSMYYYNLGNKFLPSDSEAAISHFKKSIELFPDWQSAYFNLAIVYVKSGDMTMAKDYYSKAKKIGNSEELERFSDTFSFLE